MNCYKVWYVYPCCYGNIYLIEIAKIWHRYPLCQEGGGLTKVIMRLAVVILNEISQHLWGGLS